MHGKITGIDEPTTGIAGDDMDMQAEGWLDIPGNKTNQTHSGQRPGKEKYHIGSEKARDSSKGDQLKGKGKTVEEEFVNAISSDHSDPREKARKYRRSKNSPSPTKLKEQVSDSDNCRRSA